MEELVKTSQKFDSGDSLIELYVVEFKDTKYYVQGTHSSNISFRDSDGTVREYVPVPIKMEGLEQTSSGSLPRPALLVANSIFSYIDVEPEEFIGARVIRRQTLKKLLERDPPVEYPIQKFIIDRVASSNRVVTEYELASPFDLAGLTLPKRKIIGHFCAWEYQGSDRFGRGGCTWSKTCTRPEDPNTEIFIDRDDNVISGFSDFTAGTRYTKGSLVKYTDSTGLTTIYRAVRNTRQIPKIDSSHWVRHEMCGKRLSSCKARFQNSKASTGQTASAALPFGGFPGSRKFQ